MKKIIDSRGLFKYARKKLRLTKKNVDKRFEEKCDKIL